MHSAPSVSYPVGRCAFQRQLYVCCLALTTAVLLAWALNQGFGWTWVLAASSVALAACLGFRVYAQVGMLIWDGHVWSLHGFNAGAGHALGEVHVVLDVKKALLLRWQPASDTLPSPSHWLWLGSENLNACWHDLRCAVYQRADR